MSQTSFNLFIVYSLISLLYPKDKEHYFGYCSASIGLGLMLGPVLGQTIYSWLHFERTFYFFAILFALVFLASLLLIPSTSRRAEVKVPDEEIRPSPMTKEPVGKKNR